MFGNNRIIYKATQKFSTAQWRAALEHEAERGNANKISEYADSPLFDSYSADEEMMSYAITSTTKKDKKKKRKDENVLARVQSLPAADDPIESNNAEFGLQQQESRNIRDFRETVQSVRDILGQNGGDNPCANFFGGAGLDALNAIVNRVNAQRENETFTDLGNTSTGIRMNIPTQVNPGEVGIPRTSRTNLDGTTTPTREYVAVAPNSIAINTRGPFVSRSASRIGRYASGTLESRVIQLLHEIGHLVITDTASTLKAITVGGRTRIYRQVALAHLLALDGNNSGLSVTNTTSVTNACGNQINGLNDEDD